MPGSNIGKRVRWVRITIEIEAPSALDDVLEPAELEDVRAFVAQAVLGTDPPWVDPDDDEDDFEPLVRLFGAPNVNWNVEEYEGESVWAEVVDPDS